MKNIKLIILITSIISFLLSFNSELNDPRHFVFLLPLLYGVLYFLFMPVPKPFGAGMVMLNIVLFCRYILFTPIYVLSDYYSTFDNLLKTAYLYEALIYMLLEMSIIIFVINRYYKSKNNNIQSIRTKKIHLAVPLIIFLIAIYIIKRTPEVLSNYSFILNSNTFVFDKEFKGSASDIFFIKWSIYLLSLYLFSLFYRKHQISKKYIFVLLSIAPFLISSLFYFSSSRLSILLPLLSAWFLGFKYYPKYSKKLSIWFLSYGAVAMIFMSLLKFFQVSSLSSVASNIDYRVSSFFLNSYFQGLPNVAVGIQASDYFSHKINLQNISDELFAQTMFINDFFDVENRATFFFNDYLNTKSNIVPTIAEGTMLLGRGFGLTITALVSYLIPLLDRKAFRTQSVDTSFIYSYFAITVAFFIAGNLNLISDSFFNYFIPLFILAYINRFSPL